MPRKLNENNFCTADYENYNPKKGPPPPPRGKKTSNIIKKKQRINYHIDLDKPYL